MSGARIYLIGESICAFCHGSGREPSPITSISTPCGHCEGHGSFVGGTPNRGMPLDAFIRQQQQDSSK